MSVINAVRRSMFSRQSVLIATLSMIACGSGLNGSTATPKKSMLTVNPSISAVENSGVSCLLPQIDGYADLKSVATLPNPFRLMNGKLMTKKSEWICRRAEVSRQLQFYELGEKPDAKVIVSAVSQGSNFVVTVQTNGASISFTATIQLPTTGSAPYPAMIGIGRSSLDNAELLGRGIAIINFPNNDVAEQLNGTSRGRGKFFTLYDQQKDSGAMVAWAWGVSRLIDALEKTPVAQIDTRHLGVTGCSRNGKGALIAGALDERIALTIPQESGSGGSASWRVSDSQRAAGQNVQTLNQIVTENVWFRSSFAQFSSSADRLPFDHHQVLSLVAPRGLLVIENTSMEWLGNVSTYATSVAARETWIALGVGDHMGVSQVGDHNHCAFPPSQQPEVDVFVDKFLRGIQNVDTNVVKTDGNYTFDRSRWIDWATPQLN
jgi:hypothetical protein